MPQELHGELDGRGVRIAIVAAKFSSEITDRLLARALQTLGDCGTDVERVPVARVPGSLELAVVARKFARSGRYDAVLCIGCVIRGDTTHYDCVVNGATQGITAVAAETGVPVIFGVLTCDTEEQAVARIENGAYAARAAIEMANLMKKVGGRRQGTGDRNSRVRRGPQAARRKPRR